MKKYVHMFILLWSTLLFSQFQETIQVTNSDGFIHFSGEEAVRFRNEKVYLTYFEELENTVKIMFALSENHGLSFQYVEIDEMEPTDLLDSIDEPVLELLDNGSVIIVYIKLEAGARTLYRALSNENAEDFDIQIIEEYISDEVHLIEKSDILTLVYKHGASDGLIQLSEFQYFSETEKSINEDGGAEFSVLKFWGPDVLEGPVHSNDDIWVQQAGGGINGGWPTFYDMVTTSGIFRKYPTGTRLVDSGAPMDQIFQGGDPGWLENVMPVDLLETATEIRENGIRPFDGINADIVYVKLNEAGYESMLGFRELSRVDSFKVYSWFPHNVETAQSIIDEGGNWFEDAEHIWTNYIPIYETVWESGPSGNVVDQSVWVESELWIEGVVSGMQTWGCADTVFITSDIYYINTAIGESPDDEFNLNTIDYFGLVSEEQILIKYKHIDPWSGELRDDNCNDIYLYGAYTALGKGDTLLFGDQACHYDGIFSYEYQHPHGSTPDFSGISPYTGNDTVFTMIDLHKFIYPGDEAVPEDLQDFILHGNNPPSGLACGYPFESDDYLNSYPNNGSETPGFQYQIPYGTDLPWYNPVWPESVDEIVFERGNLNIFGSITHRRRGFIHRSGIDPYNHDGNEWDLENYQYDGTHPSTGYSKDYRYDTRLSATDLVDFPHLDYFYTDAILKVRNSLDGGEEFEAAIDLYSDLTFNLNRVYLTKNEYKIILSLQNDCQCINLFESENNGLQFDYIANILMSINNWMNYDHTYLTENNSLYFFGDYSFQEKSVNKYNFCNNEIDQIYSDIYPLETCDFSISNNGARVYCSIITWETPQYISIDYSIDNDQFDNNVEWFSEIFNDVFININSELVLTFNENDSLYLFLNSSDDWISPRNLFLIKGSIDGITPETEDEIPPAVMSMNIYPNPFNPTTTITFSLTTEPTENTELEIYNIKGQKIKKYSISNDQYSLIWDGTDEAGKAVGSGIYFARLKTGGKALQKKMVLIK
jgi:type IX secretion system substrate protein